NILMHKIGIMGNAKTIEKATSYRELLDKKYGNPNSSKREEFEDNAHRFIIGEMIKATRKDAGLTQEELAVKIDTQKSYISRIESGKADIQISNLFRIFEQGFGRKLLFSIE